jgi:RTX calcium-binding nonapeptide repeat (4 copies)
MNTQNTQNTTARRIAAAVCEALEPRQLLTALTFDGTDGADTITLNLQQWSDTRTVQVTINGQTTSYSSPFYNQVTIYAKGGNDNINIYNADQGIHVTAYGDGGDDTFTFGTGLLEYGYDAYGGSGVDKVVVDRNPDYQFDENMGKGLDYKNDYVIDANGVVFSSLKNSSYRITTHDVESLDFSATGSQDTIWIDSVAPGRKTTVHAGKGYDKVIVGNGDVDSNILGELNVYGDDDFNDVIEFQDKNDTANDTYNLTSAYFQKPGTGLTQIDLGGLETMRLYANDGSNMIRVSDIASNNTVEIKAGGGGDTIELGGGDLDTLHSAYFLVDGADQFPENAPDGWIDTLVLKDQNDATNRNYGFSNTQITFTGGRDIPFQNTIDRVQLFGSAGNNVFSRYDVPAVTIPMYIDGGNGNDSIKGGAADDTLLGNLGNDTLNGSDGNDLLDGGMGGDIIIGGNNSDTVTYESRSANLLIDFNTIGNDGAPGENDWIMDDVETIKGGMGADTITMKPNVGHSVFGNGGNDTITGSDVADYLDGGTGVDSLFGNGGLDFLFLRGSAGSFASGGDGNDQIFIDSSAGMTIEGNGGNDFLNGGGGNDTIIAGAGNDQAFGGAGDDSITGDEGNDLLEGNAGNDSIWGGADNDTLYGHAGADVLRGGLGDDYINAADGFGIDQLTGNEGTDTLLMDRGDSLLAS